MKKATPRASFLKLWSTAALKTRLSAAALLVVSVALLVSAIVEFALGTFRPLSTAQIDRMTTHGTNGGAIAGLTVLFVIFLGMACVLAIIPLLLGVLILRGSRGAAVVAIVLGAVFLWTGFALASFSPIVTGALQIVAGILGLWPREGSFLKSG